MTNLSPNHPIFKGKGPSEIFYLQSYFGLFFIFAFFVGGIFPGLNSLKTIAATNSQTCNAPTGTNGNAQSNDTFKTNWSGSSNCTFNKFDSNLGVLNSVKFTLDGTVIANVKVERQDTSADKDYVTTVKSIAKADLTLGNSFSNSPLLTVTPESNLTDKLANFDGVIDYAGQSGRSNINLSAQSTNSATISDTNQLQDFTGSPLETYVFPVSTVGKSGCEGSGNVICQNETYSAAKVTLVYNYSTKPTANSTAIYNNDVGEIIPLKEALVSKDDKTAFFTIKSLPERDLCNLVQNTLSGEIPVIAGQVVDVSQTPNIVCKPLAGSEGKQASFKYTVTSVANTESEAATVILNFLKPGETKENGIKATKEEIEATVGEDKIKTQNCNLKAKMGQNLAITDCLKSTQVEAINFRISAIKNGTQSSGQKCGDFYLNDAKLIEGQIIPLIDQNKIEYLVNSEQCEKCDIGFDFVAIDKEKNESNVSQVKIMVESCTPDVVATLDQTDDVKAEKIAATQTTTMNPKEEVNTDLARSGGLFKNTNEVFVLVGVLISSIVFFFSSLSTENLKKMFSRR